MEEKAIHLPMLHRSVPLLLTVCYLGLGACMPPLARMYPHCITMRLIIITLFLSIGVLVGFIGIWRANSGDTLVIQRVGGDNEEGGQGNAAE